MTRMHFEEELKRIHDEILAMGARVEEDIRKAMRAFVEQDKDLAGEVKADDAAVNSLQIKIEDQAAVLIATQQPVARDLRELVAVLRLVSDLERIGDYAVHLAKAAIKFAGGPSIKPFEDLVKMAEIGASMLGEAVSAFLKNDVTAARACAERDNEVDEIHKRVVKGTIALLEKDPGKAALATKLLATSGFLERLGDHVTDICESIVYMVEGSHAELND
jgi:phosphate transport system protein